MSNSFGNITDNKKTPYSKTNIDSVLVVNFYEDLNFVKNEKPIKLATFDLDDTIIKTKSGEIVQKDCNDWEFLYDTITVEKLIKLHNDGYIICFFSNQKSISVGKVTEQALIDKLVLIQNKLDIKFIFFAPTESDMYRKPSIGLWNCFLNHLKLNKNNIDYKQSFYVGDAAGREKNWKKGAKKDHSDCDRKFAINIGLQFYTPEEYFKGESIINHTLSGLNPATIPDITQNSKDIIFTPHIKQEMIIMVGYPGSGKSDLTKSIISKYNNYEHINMDTCKTSVKCLKLAESGLSNKKSIIIDNTNPDIASRNKYIEIATKYGVYIRCFNFNTSMEISQHNSKYRNFITNNKIGRIPDVVYYTFRKKYVKPTINEKIHKVIDIDYKLKNITPEYLMWYE